MCKELTHVKRHPWTKQLTVYYVLYNAGELESTIESIWAKDGNTQKN